MNSTFWIFKIPPQYFPGGELFDPMWSLMKPRFRFFFIFLEISTRSVSWHCGIKLPFTGFERADFELNSRADCDPRRSEPNRNRLTAIKIGAAVHSRIPPHNQQELIQRDVWTKDCHDLPIPTQSSAPLCCTCFLLLDDQDVIRAPWRIIRSSWGTIRASWWSSVSSPVKSQRSPAQSAAGARCCVRGASFGL